VDFFWQGGASHAPSPPDLNRRVPRNTTTSPPPTQALVPQQLEPVFPMSFSFRGWQVSRDGVTPAHASDGGSRLPSRNSTSRIPSRQEVSRVPLTTASSTVASQSAGKPRRHVSLVPGKRTQSTQPVHFDGAQAVGPEGSQYSVETHGSDTSSAASPTKTGPLPQQSAETRPFGLSLTRYSSDSRLHLERPFNRKKLDDMAASLVRKATSFMPPLSYC
jgi:hypothetical protein